MHQIRPRGLGAAELLLAVALAALLVAVAVQLLRATGARGGPSREVAELDQSLRLSMNVIERAVRAAGAGMGGRRLRCGSRSLYAVQFWDRDAWPPGAPVSSPIADGDPDVLRVIAAQPDTNLFAADGADGAEVRGSLADWSAGDLFVVLRPPPLEPCVRRATAVAARVAHAPDIAQLADAADACNPTPDACLAAAPAGAPVRHFTTASTFRVLSPPPGSNEPPRLALLQSPLDDGRPPGAWSPIADHIEDLQLALVLDDGRVCDSVDDPARCDPARAAAVRVTLQARSRERARAAGPSLRGGFEDEPARDPGDGYLRRSLTAEIPLRN